MFLHFFHDQILEISEASERARRFPGQLAGAMVNGLRLAALLSKDELRIPTIDLVQSPLLAAVTELLGPLASAGVVKFVGSTSNVDELQQRKLMHFAGTDIHQRWNEAASRGQLDSYSSALHARGLDTTTDLLERWRLDMGNLDAPRPDLQFAPRMFKHAWRMIPSKPSASDYEEALAAVPDRLEDHALLWNVIEDLRIMDVGSAGPGARYIECGMAHNWIRSHMEEYATAIIGSLPWLGDISFGLKSLYPDKVYDYNTAMLAYRALGIEQAINDLTIDEIIALRSEPSFVYLRDTALAVLYNLFDASEQPPDLSRFPPLARLCKQGREAARRFSGLELVMVLSDLSLQGSSLQHTPVIDQVLAEVTHDLERCSDYAGEVRFHFDELVRQSVLFLRACMDTQARGSLGRRSYLFDPDATERHLVADLHDWLAGNYGSGAILAEVQQIGGGRADLLVHFGSFRLPIELKRERSDASRDRLARFQPQLAAYESTDVSLGMLVVLDLTRDACTDNIRDNVWVTELPSLGPLGRPRFIVTIRIPGRRRAPSSL